jgi:hypothetical protein
LELKLSVRKKVITNKTGNPITNHMNVLCSSDEISGKTTAAVVSANPANIPMTVSGFEIFFIIPPTFRALH